MKRPFAIKDAYMTVNGELVDYVIMAKTFNAFTELLNLMQVINAEYWLGRWARMRMSN